MTCLCFLPSIVKVAFLEISLSKVTLAFEPQKMDAQELIRSDEQRKIPIRFICFEVCAVSPRQMKSQKHIKNVGQNFYLLFEVLEYPWQSNKE